MRTRTEKFTFTGSLGDELAARLDQPADDPIGFVLFAHCFTCSKDLVAASTISAALVAEGFGVLRFDFTGLGSSEGEFANTNFSSNVSDIVAAADALRDRLRGPDVLVGHSLGGAAVIAAGPLIPEVKAVATIGAPADPEHIKGLFDEETLATITSAGEAEVTLAGRQFRVRRQFLEDVSQHQLEATLASFDRALLVLHSPVDDTVGIDNAQRIFDAAAHPKSLVAIDGADHLLTNRADARHVAAILASWSQRYVPASRKPGEEDPNGPAPEGIVIVEETHKGKFTQLVSSGRHHFPADEPIGVGDDTGPSPYDLLLAGLGACTSMTLRMYAERKKLALDHIRVALSHERVHGTDCSDPEGNPCRMHHIERTIEIDGQLSQEDRDSLARIADRCPVHLTLEGDIHVNTTLS